MKKVNFILLLLLFGLPFIFQKTLYPFFRFGMFAQPISQEVQKEQFYLMVQQKNGSWVPYQSQLSVLDPSKLDYWCRNYFYRNETCEMIEKIKEMEKGQDAMDTFGEMVLVRVFEKDSSVYCYHP